MITESRQNNYIPKLGATTFLLCSQQRLTVKLAQDMIRNRVLLVIITKVIIIKVEIATIYNNFISFFV